MTIRDRLAPGAIVAYLAVSAFFPACLVAGAAPAIKAESVVNAGGFTSTGDLPDGLELNTRLGVRVRGPLLAGFILGVTSSEQTDFLISARGTLSGGARIPDYHLTNAKIDVFPLYAHLYVTRERERTATAIGVGGGYELAFVEADALKTQIFGGWGGTVWAGAYYDIRPDNPETFVGPGIEAAYHIGTVRRDTFDRALAIPVRQELDTAGWSVRFAIRLAWRAALASSETTH